MESKKISFSFIKTKKAEKLPVQEKKDFIECVEEKSIKVIGGDEVKEIAPLVIPMKPNTLITTERLKEIAEQVESALVEPETVEEPLKPQDIAPENETLDQMAVRELLEDTKKAVKVDTPQLTLLLPGKSVTSGEKESTLDDYESVPVQEFGLAMLRGMGWTKTNDKSTFKPPQLRPKGLGLGADKVVKDKQKITNNTADEELTIVKNAYVKITTGKHSGYYGKVLSLDEDNGRVMVDITVKKERVSLSEFMMHPVTKSEFDKESKVINANSFEQFKKNEEQKSKNLEKESSSRENNNKEDKTKREVERNARDNTSYRNTDNEKERENRREFNRDRYNREKHRDSSEEKYKNKKKKRDGSHASLSDSDTERKSKERKSKKRYSSVESLNSETDRRNTRRDDSSDSETDKRSKKTYKEKKRHNSKESKKDKERRHDSDLETDRKNKKVEKERKRYSSDSDTDRISKKSDTNRKNDSDSDHRRSKKGERDIDKKRKGKKKRRDRDRSPNYRKHRK